MRTIVVFAALALSIGGVADIAVIAIQSSSSGEIVAGGPGLPNPRRGSGGDPRRRFIPEPLYRTGGDCS